FEYFDPNRRQTRRLESYRTDGPGEYAVRVSESYYDQYEPRPFDLTTITPTMLIDTVEDAPRRTSSATYRTLTVEADRDTGQVTTVTRISADDNFTETAVPDLADPSPTEGPAEPDGQASDAPSAP